MTSKFIYSCCVCCSGKQDLPHPAVPAPEGRAALSPSGPNGAGGRGADTNAGARRKSKCCVCMEYVDSQPEVSVRVKGKA